MSKSSSPIAIGSFVIGALVLIVVGVLVFSSGKFFTTTFTVVAVFPEGIQGLQVDSAVEFRGVPVGKVKAIKLLLGNAEADISVPVYLELTEGVVVTGDTEAPVISRSEQEFRVGMEQLVKKGLRARLKQKSMVTGQMVVSLDYEPATSADLTGIDKRFLEIPTIASATTKMFRVLQDLPLQKLLDRAIHTLDGVDQFVRSEGVRDVVSNVGGLAEQATTTITRLDKNMQTLSKSATGVMRDAKTAMRTVDGVLRSVNGITDNVNSMVSRKSAMRGNLEDGLAEMAGAARSLRILADYLEQHPDAIIKGKGF